jgi:hypothetical protein
MNEKIKFLVLFGGAVALLALEILFSGRHRPSASQKSGPSAPAIAAAPVQTIDHDSGTYTPGSASQGSFAVPSYHGGGISVIGSDGKYNLNAIRVAVPNAVNEITYVSGTDPSAIAYMAGMQATQKSMIIDNGPAGVDTSELPPAGSMLGQQKRVGLQKPN